MSSSAPVTLYVASQVARRVGRSATWIRQLADRNELRVAARTTDGRMLFAPADVDALAEHYAQIDARRRLPYAASERHALRVNARAERRRRARGGDL